MGGGLESRCVGRVCGAVGAVQQDSNGRPAYVKSNERKMNTNNQINLQYPNVRQHFFICATNPRFPAHN